MTRFEALRLRTTDVAAARAFYARLLGHERTDIVPLPAAVRARGAPAHWLGVLGVDDVDGARAAMLARGATELGAGAAPRSGSEVLLRDPGGAVVGLGARAGGVAHEDLCWQILCVHDAARTLAAYAELFGWSPGDALDLGERGVYRQFAWQAGSAPVGSVTDIAALPGTHAHWQFYFRVADLAAATAWTRSAGGLVAYETTLADGDQIAVCDDPQGAAFALRAPCG